MTTAQLRKADKLEVAVIVDNYSDLLMADTQTARRLRTLPPDAPMAEHGLSYLIKVSKGEENHTLLMDAGITSQCLSHNLKMLDAGLSKKSGAVTVDIADVESVFLSHGHFDHFGGLPAFIAGASRKMPVVLHPGASVDRRLKMGPETFLPLPSLDENALTAAGAVLDKRSDPSTLASDLILATGRVQRVTDFEKGAPNLEANIDGQWTIDPFEDDQALAVDLNDRGLVVIGGCSHAGIINTIKHIQQQSGTERVHAVLGGFHLSGAADAVVAPTIAAMRALAPDIVVPMHCTGWEAINRFAAEMPGAFVLNSVGTTYVF